MTCTHEGFHSGEGRYDDTTGTLRYVMVCDDCRTEVSADPGPGVPPVVRAARGRR